ncbi:hypothetical protein [Niabella ginsengisoli]|uniref:Uncharacterized protein n=1 Tax=Niabella ginsengisoli TaxID=522298 RepID=A0ABS9SDT2_9BACT|nr:hypothetical protein [Niabella ginsengisoli]MCH5596510.1 hypothetical protein [Niabella ginsengisoli]
MAQWYPRVCVYSDFQGWQNHQFTGRGEFALTFGNFDVEMTVPADHIVGSTGECQNYAQVLTSSQMARYNQAKNAKEPVEIVTLADATAAEKTKAHKRKHGILKQITFVILHGPLPENLFGMACRNSSMVKK